MTERPSPPGRPAAADTPSSAVRRNVRLALVCAVAVFACAAAPALAGSPSPDPVPNGPAPDPAPVKPKPAPKKPVVQVPTPAPVVHTPAPQVVHTPAPPPPAPVVTLPPPAPVKPAVHRHRVVHHKARRRVHHPAKKHVLHKAKPVPASNVAGQTEVADVTPVRAVRTAALTPLPSADNSDEGKLLLLAAFALLLVALASASVLRLLVEFGKPRRGW